MAHTIFKKSLLALIACTHVLNVHATTIRTGFNYDGTVISGGTTPPDATSAIGWYGIALDASTPANIIVVGQSTTGYGIVARYLPSGALDTSFNSSGYNINTSGTGNAKYWNGVAISGGYIYVAGQTNTGLGIIARYIGTASGTQGTLDTSFGASSTGYFVSPSGSSTNAAYWAAIGIDGNSKVVVAGMSNAISGSYWGVVARYNSSGSALDTGTGGFNTSGTPGYYISSTATNDPMAWYWRSLAIDSSNNVVVAGANLNAYGVVTRYTSAGILDTTFGTNSHGSTTSTDSDTGAYQWYAVALDNNSKIVVAGYTDTGVGVLARYTTTGTLDTTTFNSSATAPAGPGFILAPTGTGDTRWWHAIGFDSSNNILVAGSNYTSPYYGEVARYTPAGILDTTFAPNNGYVISLS